MYFGIEGLTLTNWHTKYWNFTEFTGNSIFLSKRYAIKIKRSVNVSQNPKECVHVLAQRSVLSNHIDCSCIVSDAHSHLSVTCSRTVRVRRLQPLCCFVSAPEVQSKVRSKAAQTEGMRMWHRRGGIKVGRKVELSKSKLLLLKILLFKAH